MAKAKQQGQPSPPLEWDTNASIQLRLLRARASLRKSRLWSTFSGEQRDFEAFSIHQLAEIVEEELAKVGVTCHFTVEKWSTNGYFRLVEGWTVFTCAEREGDEYNVGDQMRVYSIGEGWDDSDKGFGKATSYARKSGMIQGMNLAIGRDNEATNQKPPQSDQQPAPQNGSAAEGSIPVFMVGRQYNLRRDEFVMRCVGFINTLQNVRAVEEFRDENAAAFAAFWRIDSQQGYVLKQSIAGCIAALKEAAEAGAAK